MKRLIIISSISFILSTTALASNEIKPPSLSDLPSVSLHGLPATPPETNEVRVLETFGHDLSKLPEQLNNFLLAVSFDKVTSGSITSTLPIGVPYITYTGSQYWVSEFSKGETDLSTLINTVLVLLLSSNELLPDDDDISIDGTINMLLIKLEENGYWPAAYLLAEHTVLASQSRNVNIPEKKATIDRLFRCGEVGFAPCQIRLGIQLYQDHNMKDKAAQLLQSGLVIYDSDPRYDGHDTQITNIARNILSKESKQ